MKFLLDTHAFIWWDDTPTQLSPIVITLLKDKTNEFYVSLASVWEMQIKLQIGKLNFTKTLSDKISHQQHTNNIQILPITLLHILALDQLPLHHRDPFDRLLIAQANLEGMVLLSHDSVFARYSVNVVW